MVIFEKFETCFVVRAGGFWLDPLKLILTLVEKFHMYVLYSVSYFE